MSNSNDGKGIETFASAEDFFNSSIDDLADLPGFETPPAGSYLLTVTLDVKKVNKKDAIEASFEVNETVELTKPDETPVADGTIFSTLFFLDNKFGVGKLKTFLKPFKEHFGVTNNGELVREHMKEVAISGTVTQRPDKDDPEKIYGNVTNITVL